jgi:phosphate-selective porin OprO/OprP
MRVALVAIFCIWGAASASAQGVALPLPPNETKAAPPAAVPGVPLTDTGASTPVPQFEKVPLKDYWKSGLRFESEDKDFSLFVGGRFQFDTVGYATTRDIRSNIPGTNALEDGVSFRRMRLDMGGTIYTNIDFYAQVDFANGLILTNGTTRTGNNATYPTDMWVTFKDLPLVGNIRVGNQKMLYSFEHLTSSRFLTFLERSLGFDAFAEGQNNGFEPGITAFDNYADKRGTWGVGLFKNTRSPFGWNVGANELEVNGRVTYLPVYEDGGCFLVHVGLGAATKDLDDGQARFRARLDARNSPSALSPLIADTGNFNGRNQQILVPEFAMVKGPFSLQAEYYASWVNDVDLGTAAAPNPKGTVFFQSAYAEAAFFLTGEHREYNREAGTFGRVVPKERLSWTRSGFTGCGAWQVAARYSYLNLSGANGNVVHDMTLGLNWFMNPNMKVQWNYFLADRETSGPVGNGIIQGFATRVAIDF